MKSITLLPEQKTFFRQIADLAFVNPFGFERESADCRILNVAHGTLGLFQRAEKIQTLLTEYFQAIQPLSEFAINAFQGKNRDSMQYAWLFYQFHEFQDRFNRFIADQERAGDAAIVLPFAEELTGRILKAGFTESECANFVALFYQLHRGFHFINTSVTGRSRSIVELRMHLWNNIFTFDPHWYLDYLMGRMEDFSTLLLGATGSGKSMAARAIGYSGFIPYDLKKRRFQESFTRSFQAMNLAQFPSSLLESELFGHKKGAFTGAIDNHQGLFSRCSANGAVFIDEIGEIDVPTQVKLLNVIQDRTFCPVGSHEKQRFEGRVISATNRDIEAMRNNGMFRDDLYYRLCSDVIVVPDLRRRLQENPEELSGLIEDLLQRVIVKPSGEMLAYVENRIRSSIPEHYAWPGNVRELEQYIRRICLTGNCRPAVRQHERKGFALKNGDAVGARQLLCLYCRYLYEQQGSYEAVAGITGLDRRTVKKYVTDMP